MNTNERKTNKRYLTIRRIASDTMSARVLTLDLRDAGNRLFWKTVQDMKTWEVVKASDSLEEAQADE